MLCGVDGTPAAAAAAEQAARVVAEGGQVRYVCVRGATGFGPRRFSPIDAEEAQQAVARALEIASAAGVEAVGDVVESDDPAGALLGAAESADLVVVGSHHGSRAGGILLGSTASSVVHRAHRPVLVARRPPEGVQFLERIVVASDGSAHAGHAVELAARLASRRESTVWLLGVDAHGPEHSLAAHTRQLADALGRMPLVLERSGHAHEEIVAGARASDASLLAVGARGVTGVKALGSVSERVAHDAPCSVLVARV